MVRIVSVLSLLCLFAVAAAADEDPQPVDRVLNGKVLSLKDDVIEVLYDFTDPAQMRDWIRYKPFRVDGELTAIIDNGSLRLKGVGAVHHRATFLETVAIEFDLTPWSDRDLGVVVSEDAESEQYVLFSINDIYFQKWDGGRVPQHMITRFGVKDPSEPAGNKVFRYVARGMKPEIKPHQKIRILASKNGRKDLFLIGDQKYSGKEMGREITELFIGIYVVKSSGVAQQVKVRGRLSPRWLERENVKLTLSAPPVVEEPEGPSRADIEAQYKVERFKAGTALVADMFAILENVDVSEPIREEAAAAIIATADKSLVPKIMPLLYSGEVATRRLANHVVRELTGKNFGFDPKADEEKRSRAIQKLVRYIQKRPKEFEPPR